MRVPVLFGVAIYFGTVVQNARREYINQQRSLHLERGQALRALGEMGRLVQTDRYPSSVLYEFANWAQQTVAVDRCSVIVFGSDRREGFVAASGDDPGLEVLALEIEKYPEIRSALETGTIVEVHPGSPPDLWETLSKQLPPDSPFRTFLVVPIKRRGEVLGVLYFRDARATRRFSEDHMEFCEQAAHLIAAFVHENDLLDQLQARQRKDALTGLLTYDAFLKQANEIAGRDDPNEISLAIVDIDNIREVNKEWGHSAGNYMIARVGQRLIESLDDAQAICRYAGDEFLALVEAPKTELRSRLQESFLEELEGDDADLPRSPRASVGIASYPGDGRDPESILEAAEGALRQAKEEGGHRIKLSP